MYLLLEKVPWLGTGFPQGLSLTCLERESQKEEAAGWYVHAEDTDEEGAHESGRTSGLAPAWHMPGTILA